MPVRNAKTQVDIEKSRKTAHKEAIARANLELIKRSIDRSSGFRKSQITQDQKHIYRRFQTKIMTSQLNHARMNGDIEKQREMKKKLKGLRLVNEDEEYDFFRRVSGEASRERASQLGGRAVTAPESSNEQLGKRQPESDSSSSEDEYDTLALTTSRSALEASGDLTPSPTGQRRVSIRVTAQSARTAGRAGVPSPQPSQTPTKNVSFDDKRRPSSSAFRSKSCLPDLPEKTELATSDLGPPPQYEPVSRTNSSKMRASPLAAPSTATPEPTLVTERDEAIDAVADANPAEPRAKSAMGGYASERPTTGRVRPTTAHATTATNIFMKKTGPTKLERHQEWMQRRNYKSAVNEFCESLLYVEEPEPVVVAPPPPGSEPEPEQRGRSRGANRQPPGGSNIKQEPAKPAEPVSVPEPEPEPAQTVAPTKPAMRKVKIAQPMNLFDYSDLFLRDTAVKRKPIIEVGFDPTEYRREGGNPNVRNLTMMRVTFSQ